MNRLRFLKAFAADIIGFAATNKAWWLIPVIVMLLAVAALALFSSSAAPFIYALF